MRFDELPDDCTIFFDANIIYLPFHGRVPRMLRTIGVPVNAFISQVSCVIYLWCKILWQFSKAY